MSDFFLPVGRRSAKKSAKRRANSEENAREKRRKTKVSDEELSSESDDELSSSVSDSDNERGDDRDSDNGESSEAKRLRLAERYLEKLRDEAGGDDEKLSERLQEDVRWRTQPGSHIDSICGRLADLPAVIDSGKVWKGHLLAPTCIALTTDDAFCITGSKDGSLICWDLEHHQKKWLAPPSRRDAHAASTPVLCCAVSDDSTVMASGGNDGILRLWDIRASPHKPCQKLKNLSAHRGPINGLAFQKNSKQLFSCSSDRTVKMWSGEMLSSLDTLFGHEAEVFGIDVHVKEAPVTAGRDRTTRLWQISQGNHLKFLGHSKGIECVRKISEEAFVSGSQDGALAVWHCTKKRPLFTFNKAHGPSAPWIVSIGGLRNHDLIGSGSMTGGLRLWRVDVVDRKLRSPIPSKLAPVASCDIKGFVNGIVFAKEARFVAAAVGQEHRLGRWWRDRDAKNGLCVVPLCSSTSDDDGDDDDDGKE